jgi:nucleoside-diphosphate-sugar epimerase
MSVKPAVKTVLIVGGSGFIGRHLCAYLASLRYPVIATTRKLDTTGTEIDGVRFQQLDLDQPVDDQFECASFDCIIYLAARAHIIKEDAKDPLAAFRRVNCEAALEVATRTAEQGVRRFIYLSSIGVNGVSNQTPFSESDAVNPVEPYAQSKLEAEQALATFCRASDMELVILRPVLVYGSNAPGNFARLRAAVSAGRWLPIGGFDNRRSLLAVENLVQLIELCIHHPNAANCLRQFLYL